MKAAGGLNQSDVVEKLEVARANSQAADHNDVSIVLDRRERPAQWQWNLPACRGDDFCLKVKNINSRMESPLKVTGALRSRVPAANQIHFRPHSHRLIG